MQVFLQGSAVKFLEATLRATNVGTRERMFSCPGLIYEEAHTHTFSLSLSLSHTISHTLSHTQTLISLSLSFTLTYHNKVSNFWVWVVT